MIPRLHSLRLLACALLSALAGGCAGLPRSDPTGERVFVWPKDQPAAAGVLAPSSAVVAPPVLTDPFFPQPPAVAAAPVATPGVVAGPAVTPASLAIAAPQDRVSITPERVLAPVGSEVVLKASICTAEGYTLADQRVEWMLGRNGVGQFVEVSGKGWFHPPLLPWNRPEKVDNYLAHGFTANGPLCIDRGTPNPADDVNINRGDAWISVTSPNEGTSYVTAYTPTVESWDQRKSAATIYWVDVQWTFPPPTVAGGGRAATLTTQVTRQSNGTPIEGWIVRYELAEGGGALAGGAGGQVVEVRTDANGNASVQATPTAAGAASTPVNIQLIRPAGFGEGDAPRLVVGTGSSVIQWGGSSPYFSPGASRPPAGATPSPTTPVPTIPDAAPLPTTPPGGVWGPPGGAGAGIPGASVSPGAIPNNPLPRPQLELTLSGDPQALAGGKATLTMRIRNVGAAPATNVRVVDQFDPGLTYPPQPNARRVEFNGIGTIAAGGEANHSIPFDVMQPGRLCHNVSVVSAENATDSKQFCLTAEQPPVEKVGAVRVLKEGPAQRIVGETALFRITVENTGEMPLVDIRVVDEYPTQFFQIQPPTDLGFQVVSGRIAWTIPRLEVGTKRSYEFQALCLASARPVLPKPPVRVTALTDPPTRAIPTAAEVDIEILPRQTTAPTSPPLGAAPSAPLKVEAAFSQRQPRIGSRATCQVAVVNSSGVDDQNVQLRIVIPPQLAVDVAATQSSANVQPTLVGDQLTFGPVAQLPPGARVLYTIEFNVVGPSEMAEIVADVRSRNVTQSSPTRTPIEIIR
ncbi:MAG TPA: hypothetical protein VEQ85_11745 [Lacipirellulaceae bacterium]|nr:hypothetical protein [Lacipirellulaceae bacterium]